MDKDPSFAQTPDGRFCEYPLPKEKNPVTQLMAGLQGTWVLHHHGPFVVESWLS